MTQNSSTVSYWATRRVAPLYPPLQGQAHVDIAILGGGITGMVTAYLLKHSGKSVAVLEMTRIGSGTTGASTGHMTTESDHPYHQIAQRFSKDVARQVFESRSEAIALVERLNSELNLGCDVHRVPGYLYAERGMDTSTLEQEAQVLEELGLSARANATCPLPFAIDKAMVFPDQLRFAPLKFVEGLAHAFVEEALADSAARCRIYENTRVENVERGSDESWVIQTGDGKVTADAVVVAMHAPSFSFFSLENRAFPFQSYVIGARVEQQLPDALFWDTADPYHYTRLASSDDPNLLIIGGGDHRTGEVHHTEERLGELEAYARDRYRVSAIEYRSSHEYYEPADGLPYIGRMANTSNMFIGTGYSGDGLTYGTLAGLMLSRMALGQDSPWREVYLPTRVKPAATAPRLLAGAARIARHFIGDRLGGQVQSFDQIQAGEGATIWRDGELLATYRDPAGALHCLSPVCTHAGCIVHWNNLEKTWDCPCHGGRYTAEGKVIAAPPSKDLEPKPAVARVESR